MPALALAMVLALLLAVPRIDREFFTVLVIVISPIAIVWAMDLISGSVAADGS